MRILSGIFNSRIDGYVRACYTCALFYAYNTDGNRTSGVGLHSFTFLSSHRASIRGTAGSSNCAHICAAQPIYIPARNNHIAAAAAAAAMLIEARRKESADKREREREKEPARVKMRKRERERDLSSRSAESRIVLRSYLLKDSSNIFHHLFGTQNNRAESRRLRQHSSPHAPTPPTVIVLFCLVSAH